MSEPGRGRTDLTFHIHFSFHNMLACAGLPLFLILLLALPSISTGNCLERGWFGNNCQYMCHCKYQQQCDRTTGTCPGPCESGWFGPACQYASAVFIPPIRSSWHDNNPTTCQRTHSERNVFINFKESFAVTWLRIVGKNADHIARIQIQSLARSAYSCRTAKLDSKTVDFVCSDIGVTDRIILSNIAHTEVCEIYVSKG
ncbi:fibrinogen-related molecule [Plakobranchus ocellatus]|uniref:Fibrinogen-related molecule n=1 Tax=Plakobranchus ocellatus TaxID=259542 RepID=A0AAV4A6P6_9GAST|nr:fibrinogen-related molecule [Plakobranchus ocellatus]